MESLQDRLQRDKNVELLKRYLLEAYPDPRPDHALCGLLNDIISHAIIASRIEGDARMYWNEALTSIITRYREELEVLESNV